MTPTQRVFAILTSVLTLAVILELVRRRKLREEYSLLWIATTVGMLTLASSYELVEWLTKLSGAYNPITTLVIFGLVFLLLISVHFSIVISRLTQQVRRLTQELAILSAERDGAPASPHAAAAPLGPPEPPDRETA